MHVYENLRKLEKLASWVWELKMRNKMRCKWQSACVDDSLGENSGMCVGSGKEVALNISFHIRRYL